MKISKIIGLIGLIVIGVFPVTSYAVDVAEVCNNTPKIMGDDEVVRSDRFKQKLATYPNGFQPVEGVYILCFNPSDKTISLNEQLTITGQEGKPLVIYGFKLSGSPSIVLAGSAITLQNVNLTGNSAAVGVRVTGSGHRIDTASVSKFDTGVLIDGGDATIKEPVFSAVATEIKTINNATVVFENKSAFEGAYVGKKCDAVKEVEVGGKKYNVCDDGGAQNLIKKFVGKAPMGANECSGTIEVFKGLTQEEGGGVQSVATCDLAVLAGDKPLNFVKGDTVAEVAVGECVFQCEPGDDVALESNRVVDLKYSQADAVFKIAIGEGSSSYQSTLTMALLPSVISTGLGGIVLAGTVSEMDGGDAGGGGLIIPVVEGSGMTADGSTVDTTEDEMESGTASDYPSSFDPSVEEKKKAPQATEEQQVSQGAAGCGGKQSIASAPTSANLAQILWALAGLPVLVIRRRKRPSVS